jgi:hypothetical protein
VLRPYFDVEPADIRFRLFKSIWPQFSRAPQVRWLPAYIAGLTWHHPCQLGLTGLPQGDSSRPIRTHHVGLHLVGSVAIGHEGTWPHPGTRGYSHWHSACHFLWVLAHPSWADVLFGLCLQHQHLAHRACSCHCKCVSTDHTCFIAALLCPA